MVRPSHGSHVLSILAQTAVQACNAYGVLGGSSFLRFLSIYQAPTLFQPLRGSESNSRENKPTSLAGKAEVN